MEGDNIFKVPTCFASFGEIGRDLGWVLKVIEGAYKSIDNSSVPILEPELAPLKGRLCSSDQILDRVIYI
jgi:hypothetical protein